MLKLLSSRARGFGSCFVLAAVGLSCTSKAPSDNGSHDGGSGGAAGSAQGGTSVAGSATGGTTPSGGQGGAATGGAPAGGSGGSAAGTSGGTSGGVSGASGASGSAGAAGTSGASGSAGAGGTGSGTGCASAIFCDDFDDAPLNGAPEAPWAVQKSGTGTAVVNATHHMSGTQSVKFTVPGQADGAFIALANAPTFPIAGNAFYGRVMLWLTSSPTTTNPAVHWTLIEGSGLIQGQTYHAAYRLGGQHPVTGGNQLMANYETPDSYGGNGPSSDCWRHAAGNVIPVARWSCIEWRYDGPTNAMTMWVDGAEAVSVTGMGDGCVSQPATYPWTAPNFDTIRVGWDAYQTDTERTLWLDDFAISTTRIGCPSGTGQ